MSGLSQPVGSVRHPTRSAHDGCACSPQPTIMGRWVRGDLVSLREPHLGGCPAPGRALDIGVYQRTGGRVEVSDG